MLDLLGRRHGVADDPAVNPRGRGALPAEPVHLVVEAVVLVAVHHGGGGGGGGGDRAAVAVRLIL